MLDPFGAATRASKSRPPDSCLVSSTAVFAFCSWLSLCFDWQSAVQRSAAHCRACPGHDHSVEVCHGQSPGANKVFPTVSQSAVSGLVTLDTDDFKLTLPTAANDLAFLKETQETAAKGEQRGKISLLESEPWKGMTWADIMKTHNNECNPSGAIRSKRGASTSVEELLG